MAEGEGFEPPETCASLVFMTSAFDRSATPPRESRFYPVPADVTGRAPEELLEGVLVLVGVPTE